jgi:hypothetical protein
MTVTAGEQRQIVVTLSIGLYLGSLLLPALEFEKRTPVSGVVVLAYGWLGAVTMNLAWLANPMYVAALVSIATKRNVAAGICSAVSLCLGLMSFSAKEWWFDESGGVPITGLGIAFYLWMASFALVFVGTLFLRDPGKGGARNT